jgi:hypothetical protein
MSVAINAVIGSSRFECFPVKVSQLDCCHGRFEPLVAEFHSGAVDGLVNRIGGNDAEDDWQSTFQSGVRDATRNLVGDVIEVGSLTSNNSTQTDYCIKLARLCQSKSEQRYLECARHSINFDASFFCTQTLQAVERALDKAAGDELIPPARDDSEAKTFRV